MRQVCLGSVVAVAMLSLTGIATAEIVGTPSAADDGDGVIVCESAWNQAAYELTITGNHYRDPEEGITGHVLGAFNTDTELDPTVGMINYIDNDTDFDWTGYDVTIYMNKTFTIDSAMVMGPLGWTANRVQPLLTAGNYTDEHGNTWGYAGTINMSGPSAVAMDNTLSFMYVMSFVGSVSYSLEMTPVPEPVSLSLLAVGGLALLRRRR